MTVEFYKYQGTGNDFIIIDNREKKVSKNDTKIIEALCNRRIGIGADGLIFLNAPLQNTNHFDMVYCNADGKESSMCGNGGRCIVAFAKFLNIINTSANFTAIDGNHKATIKNQKVSLQMQDVRSIATLENAYFLDTGSPHYVTLCNAVSQLDVKREGALIRYNERFKKEGTNVNFVEAIAQNTYKIRTYERGVEDETLSCGTGATAVALAMHYSKHSMSTSITLNVEGGKLDVSFTPTSKGYQDIWLTGLAKQVFKGKIEWKL